MARFMCVSVKHRSVDRAVEKLSQVEIASFHVNRHRSLLHHKRSAMGSDTLAHGPSGQDCVDLFCTECFIKLHRKGKRRQHVHLTIDNTGRADDAAPIREAPRALLYRREAVHDASAHVWIHAQYSTVPYMLGA